MAEAKTWERRTRPRRSGGQGAHAVRSWHDATVAPYAAAGGNSSNTPLVQHREAVYTRGVSILWYVQHGQRSRAARLPLLPWYQHKAGTTFSDMLATLRRASWRQRLFDPASSPGDLRKRLRPLVDYVASAA